jgi:hypothetical protein
LCNSLVHKVTPVSLPGLKSAFAGNEGTQEAGRTNEVIEMNNGAAKISAGKTDLLDGFISKRGRPFAAYLKLEDGKVGFEFPEKTARA